MRTEIIKNVARKYATQQVVKQAMVKQAGEVRFIKDNTSGDLSGDWAYQNTGTSSRTISKDFVFNPKQLKPLAKTLRSVLMALGHATSGYNTFVKIKSRNISPDGNLGGMGYIMEISKIRKGLMNCIEALSAMSDCMYDELGAPHWNPEKDVLTPRDRLEVQELVKQVNEIQQDPEEYAEAEEDVLDEQIDDAVEEYSESDYDFEQDSEG